MRLLKRIGLSTNTFPLRIIQPSLNILKPLFLIYFKTQDKKAAEICVSNNTSGD